MSQEPNSPPRRRIFISYSHLDIKFARAFHKNLTAMLSGQHEIGYRPEDIFFDRGTLNAGDAWSDSIEKALREVEVLILLVSLNSISSKFCIPREASAAAQRGALIIPVILTMCSWKHQMIPGHPQQIQLGDLEAVPYLDNSTGVKVIDDWPKPQHAWHRTTEQIFESLEKWIKNRPKPEPKKAPEAASSKEGQSDKWERAAAELLAACIRTVKDSLEKHPVLRKRMVEALELENQDDVEAISGIIARLLRDDLNRILEILWDLALSPEHVGLKPALEEMVKQLPRFGVKQEWVIETRKSLENRQGRLGGGTAFVPKEVFMPSAEILKAAIFDGPAQWAKSGEGRLRGGVDYHPSIVEPASPDVEQRFRQLEDYVQGKEGPATSPEQRSNRIKTFLELELKRRTPFYMLLDQNDALLRKLQANKDFGWSDAFIMVRRDGEKPVLGNLEKTEGIISRILEALSGQTR